MQTHESDQKRIECMQKELAINKELVKSLQTIVKVKEF
jgi:ribosomal protein S20